MLIYGILPSNLTKQSLLSVGVPEESIKVIPLGVNLNVFFPVNKDQKQEIRRKLGLPENKVIIGSFQKDGNGWGDGFEPKLIKGPDIFCDVVEQLSKKFDLLILLTGPARGYVKKRLEKSNIQYLHYYLDNTNGIGDYYRALDLYLSTARVEGGPQCVLESLASGVPIVATKVGLAPDIINHGENGLLCEICDVEEIANKSTAILEDSSFASKIVSAGLLTAKEFSWKLIAERHLHELYRPLL